MGCIGRWPHWVVEHPERVLTLLRSQGDSYMALCMMHMAATKDGASMLPAETLYRQKAKMAAKYQAFTAFRSDNEELFTLIAADKTFLACWKANDVLRDMALAYC